LFRAEEEMEACDVCLVVGTSSVVYPAAMFAPAAARREEEDEILQIYSILIYSIKDRITSRSLYQQCRGEKREGFEHGFGPFVICA
jgi:NAD-dependent SIR2 family protein deacetylase